MEKLHISIVYLRLIFGKGSQTLRFLFLNGFWCKLTQFSVTREIGDTQKSFPEIDTVNDWYYKNKTLNWRAFCDAAITNLIKELKISFLNDTKKLNSLMSDIIDRKKIKDFSFHITCNIGQILIQDSSHNFTGL